MNDPRLADAVRKLVPLLEKQAQDIIDLKADNTYMKAILREIKKSVTRKGKSVEG
jgi:hypothetical protein